MIYLNSNKVNKFGNFNRAYLNGRLIYQTYVEADEPTSKTYVYVETNNQWELSTVDGGQGYTTFQSFSNKGQSVTTGALLRIRFFGFENFSFKYRSEGWSNYIYLCVGDVDVDLSSKVDTIRYNTTGVKYNTKGNATPKEWKNAEYSNLDPTVEHFIDVIYIKTFGTSFNEDRGYISLVTSETIEKWEASTTEYITVKNADNTYTFYTKEYKYISFDDGETWIPTSNSRQGETELEQSLITVEGYLCNSGNKYTRNELFVDLGGNLVGTQIYKTGDLIEEGAEDCRFVSNFIFNYNFNDYNNGVVPNHQNASWDYDLQLYGTPVIENDGENNYVKVTNGDTYSHYKFNSAGENIFNQTENGMTFICKVSGGSGADLFSNRWGDGFGYMVRPYADHMTIHTKNGEQSQMNTSTNPCVYVITVDENNFITYYNLTENTTTNVTNGGSIKDKNTGVVWFGSNYISSGAFTSLTEKWTGNCYWMFVANRVLTKDEINLVVDLNGM